MIDKFLWKRHKCPLLLRFYVSVILFFYFCDLYISEVEKQTPLKLVLDFESPSKFWGFRIIYRLPVGLPLLRKRPIKNIVQVDYPRVSPGAHPLTKKPEDSGYEIAQVYIRDLKIHYGDVDENVTTQ